MKTIREVKKKKHDIDFQLCDQQMQRLDYQLLETLEVNGCTK
jgi:hypothetical protein